MVAVVNEKGKVGKTTAAIYLAAALVQQDKTPHRQLPNLAQAWVHMAVDTPPGDLRAARSAALGSKASLIPIPLSPTDLPTRG